MTSDVIADQHSVTKTAPLGRITFEEFLDWLDPDVHAEWVDGEVVMAPPPSTEHQMLRDFLLKIVGIYVEAQALGMTLSAPYLMRLPNRPSGREPDLLFLSQERAGNITHQLLDGPADLVVQIVSPESIGRDRGEKFVEYEAAGVREYWLIDPLRQQAEFYQLSADGLYRPGTIGSDGVYRSLALAGFWLRVEWLWQTPLPPVLNVLKELGVV